jgi:prepilin-type processing-associated H-X9-DG protein
MYTDDSSEKLINNYTVPGTQMTVANQKFANWVNNLIDWGTAATMGGAYGSPNTNVTLVQRGILSPYLAGNLGVYRCPSDNYLSAVQKNARFPYRIRSMSMNSHLGAYTDSTADQWAKGQNYLDPGYRQFLKFSDLAKPAMIFVTLDEHADSINDGWFDHPCSSTPNPSAWVDFPGKYHNGACGISFADGHAEVHKWLAPQCIPEVRTITISGGGGNFGQNPRGKQDYNWLAERASVHR